MTRQEAINDSIKIMDSICETTEELLERANPDQAIALHKTISVCSLLAQMCKILAQLIPEETEMVDLKNMKPEDLME